MCNGDQDHEFSDISRLDQDKDGNGQAIPVMRNSGAEQEPVSMTLQAIVPPSPGQTATPQQQPAVDPRPSIKTASSREAAPRLVGESSVAVPPNLKTSPLSPNMLLTELCKSPKSTISKLRHSLPQPVSLSPDYDADLVSRDKVKQKEAVKRYLEEKVRNDWNFVWPSASVPAPPVPVQDAGVAITDAAAAAGSPAPAVEDLPRQTVESCVENLSTFQLPDEAGDAGSAKGSDSDELIAESIYSTVSEDSLHFRPRAEWASDLSEDEDKLAASPFVFDSPDAVGTAVQQSINARKARRRRAERDEMSWNDGLACFNARRDAWTGAKTVRVKPQSPTPLSTSPTRRIFWRPHRSESTSSAGLANSVRSRSPTTPSLTSALSPTSTHASQQTDATSVSQCPSEPDSAKSVSADVASKQWKRCESHTCYPVETLLPIPPPLLPPQNPMRATVTPSIYLSLYDKIIVHNLQPSCPVNLTDMIRACVTGWKRDGEWPPRPAPLVLMPTGAELVAMRRRKNSNAARQEKQEKQEKQSKRLSTATMVSTKRLSLNFGFLTGRVEDKEKDVKDDGATEFAKEGKKANEAKEAKHAEEFKDDKEVKDEKKDARDGNQNTDPPDEAEVGTDILKTITAAQQSQRTKRLSTATMSSTRRISVNFGFLAGRAEDKAHGDQDVQDGKQTNHPSSEGGADKGICKGNTAVQQAQKSKRLSTATAASTRRFSMNFGFLAGWAEDKAKDGKQDTHRSDEGGSRKGFRRSLQKAFSFGSGRSARSNSSPLPPMIVATGNAPEITAN